MIKLFSILKFYGIFCDICFILLVKTVRMLKLAQFSYRQENILRIVIFERESIVVWAPPARNLASCCKVWDCGRFYSPITDLLPCSQLSPFSAFVVIVRANLPPQRCTLDSMFSRHMPLPLDTGFDLRMRT